MAVKNFAFLLVLTLLVLSVNCKKKNGKKKDEIVQNICDEDDRERAVLCFCTPSEMNTAEEAVCWVYGAKISGDDAVWSKFASQPNLEKLKFNVRQDGTLLNVPSQALLHLNKLKSLEIQYGIINELPPFVFANSSTLTDISVPHNQITNLQSHSVSHLPKLTILNLDGNKIVELKRESIRDVPMLKMLFINGNNLSIIHDYAFGHLHRLEELELNTNQISVITKETFVGLKMLRYLDLRKNRLNMIGDHTFEVLENLHELVLDENNIEYISDKAFSGLKKLTKLRLSENQLKNLDGDVFKEAPNVYLLDLRMNGIEMITSEALQPLWNNLMNQTAHLWLEKNRLKCDCHISWIHTLRNETLNTEMRLALEDLTCIMESDGTTNLSLMTTEKPQDDQTYTVDVNSLQYDDEDVEYDDDIASTEYDNEAGKPPRRKIVDIPVEKLPCPEMQKATTEVPAAKNSMSWPEAASSNMHAAGERIRVSLLTAVAASWFLLFVLL